MNPGDAWASEKGSSITAPWGEAVWETVVRKIGTKVTTVPQLLLHHPVERLGSFKVSE